VSNDEDQRFFERLGKTLKVRRLDRSMIETELRAHLEEKRHEHGGQPTDPMAVLGHPVDLADEYNRVFRWRLRLRRAIIAAPTLMAVALYAAILASDFPLAQMPFGTFTTFNLGEVGWVTSRVEVAERSLVDCSLPSFVQSDFLDAFGIPLAWQRAYEEKDARCLSAVNRDLAAAIPEGIRARFDWWRDAHPDDAAFLVRCQSDGPCIRPTDRVHWSSNSTNVRNDRGKFLLLGFETEMFRHYQPRAHVTGTLLNANGDELPVFKALGLYDGDGMILVYLPVLTIGIGLSALVWILDMAWTAIKKHRRTKSPDFAQV